MGMSEILSPFAMYSKFSSDLFGIYIGHLAAIFEFLCLFRKNFVNLRQKRQIVPEGDKIFDINTKVIGNQSPNLPVNLDFRIFLYYS